MWLIPDLAPCALLEWPGKALFTSEFLIAYRVCIVMLVELWMIGIKLGVVTYGESKKNVQWVYLTKNK